MRKLKTKLGRKLLAIRRQAVKKDMRLLNEDEIALEVAYRRTGIRIEQIIKDEMWKELRAMIREDWR